MVKIHDKISGTFRSSAGPSPSLPSALHPNRANHNLNRLDVLRQLFTPVLATTHHAAVLTGYHGSMVKRVGLSVQNESGI